MQGFRLIYKPNKSCENKRDTNGKFRGRDEERTDQKKMWEVNTAERKTSSDGPWTCNKNEDERKPVRYNVE